ncbi:MAG: baseplate J/gp47 family protein [bacterium]
MPNLINATGLQVATTDEIATSLKNALFAIYGADINLDSESPDGQMVGIFSQAVSDVEDLLVDIYNMFDPDTAYGISLQRLCAINGMTIKNGTFTTTPVEITTDRALTLPGLDQDILIPFQVRDANTVWTLISSYTFSAADTQALVFQAASLGPITPLPNTITIQATPLSGVTDVNNPTVAGAVLGQAEETDVELRIRRAKSFQLAATSPADAVEAALQAITDVTDALVINNATNGTVDGTPAHSIWAIVVGGTDVEIAAALYGKLAPGCGMRGALTYDVTRPNGQLATMSWDAGLEQRLYVQFGIIPTVAGLTFNTTLLKQELAAALLNHWKLSQVASIGDIVRAMFAVEPRAILVSVGVSTDGMSYTDTVDTTSDKYFFTLAAADIDIT